MLINAGVIHNTSKKFNEDKLNPFWKYPVPQADCLFALGSLAL
jgi:hypothetical protein